MIKPTGAREAQAELNNPDDNYLKARDAFIKEKYALFYQQSKSLPLPKGWCDWGYQYARREILESEEMKALILSARFVRDRYVQVMGDLHGNGFEGSCYRKLDASLTNFNKRFKLGAG